MPTETTNKNWWKSKTILIAVLQAAATIVAAVALELPAIGWLGSLKSIIDITLRFVTNKPIK